MEESPNFSRIMNQKEEAQMSGGIEDGLTTYMEPERLTI